MTTPIAAVGAGRMGRGMAVAFAYAGKQVALIDAKPRAQADYTRLQAEVSAELKATFSMLAGFGLLGELEIADYCSRITVFPLAECTKAIAAAEVVFEGVPETLDAKRDAFALISEHAQREAIVASTTSTILSNDLQSMVKHPERFLNAHWLNPAFLVPLVELSPCAVTDAHVTARLKTLLEEIGKVPVVCAASPGYIVPRIQMLAMNEAARLIEEGVASAEDVDKATKYGFGFRFAVLGLLEFIDWGGGDILFHASNYMSSATGENRFDAPQIIKDNMASGRNGLRDGRGFLDYDNLDPPSYQNARLGAFVAMLKHLDKLPPKG
ncbi:MAG: 3-hydroxybutyryl-CoA dehydrogenase [Arenibacterium sp.]